MYSQNRSGGVGAVQGHCRRIGDEVMRVRGARVEGRYGEGEAVIAGGEGWQREGRRLWRQV